MAMRTFALTVVLAILSGRASGDTFVAKDSFAESFFFSRIRDNVPLQDLLPIPPNTAAPLLAGDLTKVPEVFFADPSTPSILPDGKAIRKLADKAISKRDIERIRKKFGNLSDKELMAKLDEEEKELDISRRRIAYQVFRINHFNKRETPDRFMEVLRENRPDLAGLPFVMGKDCRLSEKDHKQLSAAILLVQASLGPVQEDPRHFWHHYDQASTRQKKRARDREELENAKKFPVPDGRSRVAALMQMLPVESAELQLSLVGRLKQFDKTDADKKAVTIALASLAVFSQEAVIRRAAVAMLKKRDTGPASGVLLQGLRYPWPSISQNTAEAIVQLERKDLIPYLINMLEEPDPRAPEIVDIRGTKVPAVREVVRINHLRNCLLCHPPLSSPGDEAGADKKSGEGKVGELKREEDHEARRNEGVNVLDVTDVTGAVPPPGHELPQPAPFERSGGYGFAPRELQVRADITYLRQDFSMLQFVPNADPWPEMQRFDFLVRTRTLTAAEANIIRTGLAKQGFPFRATAAQALSRLTGRDAGQSAREWRAVLNTR